MGDCYPNPTDGTCHSQNLFSYLHTNLAVQAGGFDFDSNLGGPHLILSNSPESVGGGGALCFDLDQPL